jgi:NAD(P)-dependent dehydrogenase (short-subunit alcohol dehydrogenase family)
MDGKRVVITGATSGIGRAAAFDLAGLGADVLLVSRKRAAGTALARRLASSFNVRAEFIEADLSSLIQVRAAAKQIRQRWETIDVLINNAGARFDTYGTTLDGCERTFATNHLGHFLLTGLLLDRLIAAREARIITVSSSASEQAVSDGRWQYGASDFDRKQAYAKSKLANLLFAFELARRLRGNSVISLAVDPGVVATRFALNNGLLPWLKHLIYHGRRRELLRPSQGADTIVYLASTTRLPATAAGGYFRGRQQIRACAAAYDPDAAISLWKISATLAGFDPLGRRS